MSERRSLGTHGVFSIVVLASSVLLFAACSEPRQAASAAAGGGATGGSKACTLCHGDGTRLGTPTNPGLPSAPPNGTSGETSASTRAVGAHLLHLQDGALRPAIACAECHVVPTTTGHANGKVDLTFGPLATSGGAVPTWNGSSCSASYCHGAFPGGDATNAPTWTAPRSPSCGTCHGLPPAAPHPGLATGASCGDCHSGYTATTVNLANHMNGTVEVAGLACSSCHGDSTRADTALNPQFSAAPPKGTKGETATTARAVGAHALHLKDGNFLACTECHVLPTSTGHSNGTVEISFGPLARTGGASPSWNGTTCSNVYCHGSFTGGKVYAPNWTAPVTSTCGTCHGLPPVAPHPQNADCSACHTGYTATSVNPSLHLNGKLDVSALGCTACHGDSTRTATTLNPNLPAAPPKDTGGNSASTFPGVGAHEAHLNAGPLRGAMACTECHTAPPQGTHPNGTVELAWGALASSGGATPSFDAANHTCTNYCHGAALGGATHSTPSWTGGLAEVTCGSCHGLPPPSPHPGITITTSCGDCHSGFTRTTVNAAVHANGVVDLATITCASCHGDATRAGTALNPLLPSAPPKDTTGNTAATARGVGAHQRHLVAGALTAGIACSECHAVPTSNAHSNGTVDVQFGTLAKTGAVGPTWNGSGCSASYCHGNFKNGNLSYVPNWTAPAATVCGTCHGSPGSPAPGGTHPVVTATTSCASCHPGYTSTTVNAATHANGVVDVSTMTCTSCHGNSAQTATQAAPLYAAPPVDTKGNSAATTRGVGAHQAHLVGTTLRTTAIACGECHTVPAANSHSNGTADMTWGTLARAGASTPTWTGTTCTNYCHGATLVGGTLKAPTWTGGAAQVAGCAACHGAPPAAPHVQNSACGSCHTGFTSTTVAKATHIDGTVNVATLTCSTCHGLATRAATTLNPQLAAAPPSDTTGNSATSARGVGAHIAHLTGTTLRTAALACTECHTVPTAQTHANGTVDMTWGPLSRSGGATPAWTGTTCTNYCHGANLTGGTISAPTWIGGATQVAGCTACHGAPPPAPHSTSTACGSCHTGYTATSVDKATHMNGTVDITGISCTSCHGSASRAATATNPQLPASPPVGTKGETLTTTRAVGAHQAHLVNTRLRSAAITCNECHVVPTSTSHSTGVVNMTWGTLSRSGGATPTWTGTTCTNYCHGSTLAGGLAKAPTWTGDATQAACNSCHGAPPAAPHSTSTACASCHGTGYSTTTVNAATHMNGTVDVPSMNCTSCHGTATRTATTLNPQIGAAPPVGVLGETATTTRAVGAHMVHLTGGSLRGAMACTECHTLPTVNTHTSGTVELAWGTLARTGGATPSWNGTALTCANYCHGATLAGGTLTAPKWTNGSVDTTCGSCHGSPPPAPHPSITAGTNCGNCHPGFTATTVNVSTHVNGIVDVITMTCTTCHGTSTRAATALNPQLPAAPPVGTKGETLTTTRAVGAHQAHLVNTRLRSAAIACSECHVVPTSTSHASGVVNMTWGTLTRTGGVVPTWTGTTCTNYCHGATLFGGTATAPTWTGTSTQAACTSCHGAPPPAPHSTSTACASCHGTGYSTTTVNAATHMNGTVDVLAMTCTSCHGTSTRAATALNPQLPAAPPVGTKGETLTTTRAVGAHQAHLVNTRLRSAAIACSECHVVPTSTSHSTGVVNLAWGTLATNSGTVTPAWNGTALTCTNYCHGATLFGGTATAPTWTGTSTQAACTSCHGAPPPAPHSTSTACASCHGTGYSTTTVNAATHMNGTVDVLAMTCTSCHGTSTRAATALNPQLPAAPPVDTAGNTASTARGVGAHMKHLSTATRSSNFACTECHTVPTSTSHSNGSKNVTFGGLARTGGVTPAYDATSTGCSATYCHGNFTGGATTAAPLWTGAAVTCTSCHSMPATSTGRHSKHMGAGLNCSDCHSGIATGTGNPSTNAAIAGPSLHVNGAKNVVFAPANPVTFNATSKACNGTCHGKNHNPFTW